ncbi:MAG: GAF domain-containing protein [Deltaproteobacteria bacterium]|nr:MAG: GAF domain-containing protein [Deltaproteobacteria bacterium]
MSDAVAATSQGRRAAPRRDRADFHRTLLEILRSTSSHRDIASVVRDLAERLRTVACANRVSVVLHDPARNVMRLFAIAGTDAPRTTTVELPVADSPSGMVWATRRALVVRDIDTETGFPAAMDLHREMGTRSMCIVPLTSPLRQLGALMFASTETNAFDDGDVEFLRQIANQVALSVDNALHHEAAQEAQRQLAIERDRLQLLLEVNNALVSNLDRPALFSAIATCMRRRSSSRARGSSASTCRSPSTGRPPAPRSERGGRGNSTAPASRRCRGRSRVSCSPKVSSRSARCRSRFTIGASER